MKRRLLNLVLCLLTTAAFGQKDCGLPIDTGKILRNEQLDWFLSKFQSDSFSISGRVKDIPSFIRKKLACAADGFSMADEGKKWQCCCTSDQSLPEMQLVFNAISKDVVVVVYKRGGIGVSTNFIFLEYRRKRITKIWTGYSLKTPHTMKELLTELIKKLMGKNDLHAGSVEF